MCGICGVVSDYLTEEDKRMFGELMHLNVFRGWEGAGVAIIPNRNPSEIDVLKTLNTGTHLIHSKEYAEAMKVKATALIGHCRFPTKGENVIDNVHPHEIGHLVGVHNGTFRKISGKWFDDKEAQSSDTVAAFEVIAEKGVEECIKEVDGAYSLVWADRHEQTLNFLRNAERPLHYFEGYNTLFFSSEYRDLYRVLVNHNRMWKEDKIQATPINKLLSISYPVRGQLRFRDKGEVAPVRTYVVPAQTHGGHAGANTFFDQFEEENTDLAKRSGTTRERGNSAKVSSVVNFNHANAARHNGNSNHNNSVARHFIPRLAFKPDVTAASERDYQQYETAKNYWVEGRRLDSYLKNGCCYCGCEATRAQYEMKQLHWVTYNEFICDTDFNAPAVIAELRGAYPSLESSK